MSRKLLIAGIIGCLLLTLTSMIWIRYATARKIANQNWCINRLMQIDAAKMQWARAKTKGSNDIPTQADLAIYLMNNKFPVCPDDGKYTIGRVFENPTCSIPTHVLATP